MLKKEDFWLIDSFFSLYIYHNDSASLFMKRYIDEILSTPKTNPGDDMLIYGFNEHNIEVYPKLETIMVTGLGNDDPKVYFSIQEFKYIFKYYLIHQSLPEEYKPDML